jgi:peptidoglycan-associated lipoprotein
VRFDMQYQLDNFIEQVRSKGAYVIIEGHCDERGSIEYNQELGQRRANSVRDLMIKRGIPGYKLTAISKGELEPVDFNKTEVAYAKNRRVVFEVSQ